jgi:hypothetical protein
VVRVFLLEDFESFTSLPQDVVLQAKSLLLK